MATLNRHLYPPSGRRTFKVADSDTAGLPLVYLGWGKRRFGDEPVPLARTFGWVYAVVLEGTPTFLAGNSTLSCSPGSAMILDSECPVGWKDTKGSLSRVLVWIWRDGPHFGLLKPKPREWLHWNLKTDRLDVLERNHKKCLHELTVLDPYSASSLSCCQKELDIDWCRLSNKTKVPNSEKDRYNACLNWMRNNLSASHPVAQLQAYLRVSETTIQRLYRKSAGKSPLAVFQDLKAQESQRLLKEGHPIKEIAYLLGYRHSNDFSRFYKKTFGTAPSKFS